MESVIQVIGIGWVAVLALQFQGFFVHRRGITQRSVQAAKVTTQTVAPTFGEPASV